MSEAKKRGNPFVPVLAIVVLLAIVCYCIITYGNPQWHWRLYAYQAKNAQGHQIDPAGTYSGTWRNWDQNGTLKSVFQYRSGKKDGPYTTYTASGDVLSEGHYRDGELDGIQKIRLEDGTRTEIPYVAGKRHGMEKFWYPTGELAVEAPWVDGLQEGSVAYYYESGSVHSSIPFYNGKREGVYKTFHPDGSLQGDENYRGDLLNGSSKFWRMDGTPEMAFVYRDGKMDGVQTWFHPNGQKAREITMSMSIPDGRWREWDENGDLLVDDMYEMGELKKGEEGGEGEEKLTSNNE